MHWRTWIVAALAVLVGWGASAPAQAVRGPAQAVAVAKVNDVTIWASELDAVLRSSGPAPVHLPAAQRRQRQLEALGLLIDTVLMRQYLKKQNMPAIPPAEVARRFEEMKAGLEAQGKSLAEFCQDTNQTEAQLKVNIGDHLRWSAYVTKHLSDSAAQQYHRDHLDFFDKVTVEASHIVLRVPRAAPEQEKADAKARLLKIREQLVEKKADFAEMARKHSQDPRASQGGELGAFPRRWVFDEPFSKAAFALKVGEISDVVETDFGYHLIQVTKRSAGTPTEFAKIKEVVREFCAEDMRQQILAKEREAARRAGKIEVNLP